jgi:multidrug efflux pump subunit AcrA (membrane-fusion protein)
MNHAFFPLAALVVVIGLVMSACGGDPMTSKASATAATPPVTSNRIPIPANVRSNLGLTFAKAEYRAVVSTVRFPGRFEPDTAARQIYAAPVAGQVEVLVQPYQAVKPGEPLYRISGRGWTEFQREWRQSRHADDTTADAAEAVRARRNLLDRSLSQWSGLPVGDAGLATIGEASALTVHARGAGVVEPNSLASGASAGASDQVLATLDPQRLRLRATALQSDVPRLRDGMTSRITPIVKSHAESVPARMTIALEADATNRTHDLVAWPTTGGDVRLPTWARPGVAALLEVETAGGGDPEVAIPMAATIRDGLSTIIFRRDPADPDQVIRLEADLGANDGVWVQVLSGLKEQDEVVVDGIYQLKLSGAGKAQLGGHFHADGTFHPDEGGGEEGH